MLFPIGWELYKHTFDLDPQLDPAYIWYKEKYPGKVKAAGVIFTTTPIECQLAYKNMVVNIICTIYGLESVL